MENHFTIWIIPTIHDITDDGSEILGKGIKLNMGDIQAILTQDRGKDTMDKRIEFPLKLWETFKVIEKTSIGLFHRGIVHGKPGEYQSDVLNRAISEEFIREKDKGNVTLEWIDF